MVKQIGKEENKQAVCTCNRCGHVMNAHHTVPAEDCLYVEKVWGYFSQKDGARHSWCLCEACYDELISEFVIPVDTGEVTEFV